MPIVNENDTVMVDEIKFGDNDNLAAVITLLMDSDLLINLTDIDGLYNKDPRVFADADLLPEIDTISKHIERYASDIPGALGTGGHFFRAAHGAPLQPQVLAGVLPEAQRRHRH